MPTTLRIGTIAGVRVEVHFTWLLALALMAGTLAVAWFPQLAPHQTSRTYLLLGIVGAILYFLLVVAHELGHLLGAAYRQRVIASTVLYPWGGLYRLRDGAAPPADAVQIALAGPLVSLAIGVLLDYAKQASLDAPIAVGLIFAVETTSILLGLVNLLPGLPLDAGHIVSAYRGEKAAWLVGRVLGAGFIVWGIVQQVGGHTAAALWLVFAGLLLLLIPGPSAPLPALVARLLSGVRPLRDRLRQGGVASTGPSAVGSAETSEGDPTAPPLG